MSTQDTHTLSVMRTLFYDLLDKNAYTEEENITLLHLSTPGKTELALYQDRRQSLASISVVLWDDQAQPLLNPCIKFYTAGDDWLPMEVETPLGYEQFAIFEGVDRVKRINRHRHDALATYLEALAFNWRNQWLNEPPKDWLRQVGWNSLDLHVLVTKNTQILHGDIPF